MDFFESIFRFMFAWIDKIVAWLIVLVYNLFETISDTNIFNDDVLQMFSRRVYALLAIFMLFKLSFSIITYIINPDDFSDKNKGFGKLITNVFVVLILIVSVPEVFKLAYDFQGLVVKNNTINKLILGVGGSPDFGEDITAGHIMSYTVYTAFVTPNPNFPGMGGNCDDMYLKQELSAECSNVIGQAVSTDGFYKLVNAIKKYDAQSLLSYDLIVNAKKDKQFLFNYIPLISSVCAGIIAWILLVFCIDIAIRVVKLGFLQLIAPIPIISYIDPKSSKDGMFKKWTKVCISTYLDLFVRLIAISFAIFIINIVGSSEMTKLSTGEVISSENNTFLEVAFIKIFIILGALMFAKQVPKLIEDLTGMKLSGAFTMNPMKKIGESPFASAAVGGLVGAGAGAIGGFAARRALGDNIGKALLSGAGGLFGGAGRGMIGGLKSDGKGSPIKTGLSAGGKTGANVLAHAGTNFGSRMSARAATALGLNTEADIQDNVVKQYEDFKKYKDGMEARAEKELMKQPNRTVSFSWRPVGATSDVKATGNLQVLKNQIDALKAAGASAVDITNATTAYNTALKQAKADYINEKMKETNPNKRDHIIDGYVEQMNKMLSDNENGAFDSVKDLSITNPDASKNQTHFGNIDDIAKFAEKSKISLQNNPKWTQAHASKKAIGKK